MADDADPLAWTRDHTPVLRSLAAEYGESEPFSGRTVAVASHLEAKTGVLVETLRAAGAEVLFTASEPRSTHGDVARALDARDGIRAFVEEDATEAEWVAGQHALLDERPDVVLDDGCVLLARAHADHPDAVETMVGGVEQTTAGVHRLRAMDGEGVLAVPAYAANDTPMKHYFDNVHGTGESALTNVAITTNAMLSGRTVVVAGYGYCGRGVARKARGIGAHTVVTEVDPRKALEALMDGHRVMPMAEAAQVGDYFITTTGNRDVVRGEHVAEMRDGAVLANAGHFDVEVAVDDLAAMAEGTTEPRPGVTRYHLPDGRRIDLLAEGRLVNLTGPYSQGHPAAVMDTTFAVMFEAARDLVAGDRDLPPGVHPVPETVDRAVARRALDARGVAIDDLTPDQREYLADWEHADSSF